MRRVRAFLAGLALVAALPAQAVAFGKDVLPILTESCLPCHRGTYTDSSGRLRRPKGDLRLDGKAWIVKGGKDGRVLTPGNALQSAMFTRTVLPQDHEERMPATGDPLSPAQAEVLRRWIDSGASFGDWVGEAGPEPVALSNPNPEPARAEPAGMRSLDLARVAEGLRPIVPAALAKAAGDKARIVPLWHGSLLLRVEFVGHEDKVVDADVTALLPLQDHIAVLSLARTKISDAACGAIARMPRLVRLDLRDTRVGDAGVARLSALAELRAVNLFATDVTDASVPVFRAMPKLTELRLWQTKVSANGLAQLRQSNAALDVSLAPDLPEAAPPAAGQRGRRRGR